MSSLLTFINQDKHLNAWMVNKKRRNSLAQFTSNIKNSISSESFTSLEIPSDIKDCYAGVGEFTELCNLGSQVFALRLKEEQCLKEIAELESAIAKQKKRNKGIVKTIVILTLLIGAIMAFYILLFN